MTSQEIVRMLRATRRAKDITQYALAAEAGFGRDLFSKWENGIHSPKIVNLIAWAESLGFEVLIAEKK